MSHLLIGRISRIPSIALAWCLLAMELDEADEADFIYDRIRLCGGQFPEHTRKLLMCWADFYPKDASANQLSLILRDMGMVRAALEAVGWRLECTLHVAPLP